MFTLTLAVPFGCAGQELPSDLEDYAERCILLNPTPIPPTTEHDPSEDDPHEGYKNVYACDIELGDLIDEFGAPRLPYPDGTVMVKESTKPEQGYVWLVALASKASGSWVWEEYTRNFADEPLVQIPAPEEVCIDCHRKVEAIDYIYTVYQPPPQ